MKALVVILLLTGCASTTECQYYASVGAGYKVDSPNFDNTPWSARMELGDDCGWYKYGVSHHSNWFVGPPFDSRDEIHKTEIFVDYVYKIGEVR